MFQSNSVSRPSHNPCAGHIIEYCLKIAICRQRCNLTFLPYMVKMLTYKLFTLFYYCRSKLNGSWSSTGCSLVKRVNKEITCSCNHLTNFAVLMQVGGKKVSEKACIYFGFSRFIPHTANLKYKSIFFFCLNERMKE